MDRPVVIQRYHYKNMIQAKAFWIKIENITRLLLYTSTYPLLPSTHASEISFVFCRNELIWEFFFKYTAPGTCTTCSYCIHVHASCPNTNLSQFQYLVLRTWRLSILLYNSCSLSFSVICSKRFRSSSSPIKFSSYPSLNCSSWPESYIPPSSLEDTSP